MSGGGVEGPTAAAAKEGDEDWVNRDGGEVARLSQKLSSGMASYDVV
jgi:hypothetical protein